MSGLSRTPGKRVWVHSPPRVRIPPVPPNKKPRSARLFSLEQDRSANHCYLIAFTGFVRVQSQSTIFDVAFGIE